MDYKTIILLSLGGLAAYYFLRPKLAQAMPSIISPTSPTYMQSTSPTYMQSSGQTPVNMQPQTQPQTQSKGGFVSYQNKHFGIDIPIDKIVDFGMDLLTGTEDNTKEGASKTGSSPKIPENIRSLAVGI